MTEMKHIVERNQFLKTKPGFNLNKDGPKIKLIRRSKTTIK